MKFLKDEEFEALQNKANNYDNVVNGIVAKNENLTAAEVTPEVILGVINDEGGNDDSALSNRVTELEGTVETLTTTNEELTAENAELKETVETLSDLPGADSVTTVKPKAEATAVATDSVVEFANKNKGNTLAIVAEMEKAGLI